MQLSISNSKIVLTYLHVLLLCCCCWCVQPATGCPMMSARQLPCRVVLLCLVLAALATCHSSVPAAAAAHGLASAQHGGAQGSLFMPLVTDLPKATADVSTAAVAALLRCRSAPINATTEPPTEPITCPAGLLQPGNPDFCKGQFSQGVTYGIPMMHVRDAKWLS
jgi:hypothetical protein